jgi:hypothetical protein
MQTKGCEKGYLYVALIVIVLMGGVIMAQQGMMAELDYSDGYFDGFNAGSGYGQNLPIDLNVAAYSGANEKYNVTMEITKEGKIDLWPMYETPPISYYEMKIIG